MARRKVLVERLAAIRDLGSMDLLCTNETGTLTEARIRLVKPLDPACAGRLGPRPSLAQAREACRIMMPTDVSMRAWATTR